MNREEFYTAYRQARFLSTAVAVYSAESKINNTVGRLQWVAIDSLHRSIRYALVNRNKRTIYPISDNKWAVAHNHLF